jgi:uncharacterized protein (DUF58 family)
MFHRPHITICREGSYYLLIMAIVFFGALFKEVNLLLVLAGMMMGLWLFHWQALFIAFRGLKLDRKKPQAVCAGDLLTINLRLSNTRKRFGSWAVSVEEQIRRDSNTSESNHNHHRHNKHNHDQPIRTSVLFPYVPAGEERTGTYQGRLVRRGRYWLGPMRMSSRFPFGLLSRTIVHKDIDTLYVYPRLGRLTRRWLARPRRALAGADRRQSKPGPEGDFYGVREWRRGDSLRLIHWRSSARTGKFVVRQFEQPHNRDVAILIDLNLPEWPTVTDHENVELAISFAATVLTDLFRQGGGNVTLCVYDGDARCLGGPASAVLLQDMMKTLAVIEAHNEDRIAALIVRIMENVAQGTEIILISTRMVNLSDSERFAGLWSDPAHRATAQNIRCIDVSSEDLKEYFTAE